MVIVGCSTDVSHYLKIVRVDGSIPVESGQVRKAFETLLKKPIPKKKNFKRRLTFAMKLSDHHHCTICYVNTDFSDEMINCIENYLENWKKFQFDIVARGVSLFEGKSVILLEFTSKGYHDLFQTTSLIGSPEGGSDVRTPHLTYYNDEPDEGKRFISNILRQL